VSLYPDPSRHLGRRKGAAFRKVRVDRRKRKRRRASETPWEEVVLHGGWEMRGQVANVHHGFENPKLDSMGVQLREYRGLDPLAGHLTRPGYDERGLTRSDRAAWRSFLAGFVLALALVSGRAGAQGIEVTSPDRPSIEPTMYLVEPTKDTAGNPLGTKRNGQDNSLVACWWAIADESGWVAASGPTGGGRRPLAQHLPKAINEYPVQVAVGCINATGPGGSVGWSEPWAGRATLTVIQSGGQ